MVEQFAIAIDEGRLAVDTEVGDNGFEIGRAFLFAVRHRRMLHHGAHDAPGALQQLRELRRH